MSQEDLLKILRIQPFEPFRMYLSDQTSFEIRHPDQCSVGRTTAYVGVPRREVRRSHQEIVVCSLLHITHVEPLVQSADK